MATNYTKLSNVIGAPFDEYVLKQLYIRAARNSTENRSNEEVLFLANKTSWARLVSSVNISNDILGLVYKSLGVNYGKPEELAKNWILEAGTSIQNGNGIDLRKGIGPDGAYGLGGTAELGYRPMPGLTSVQIETTGRLGSLRQASIQFKVWNMEQLNIIEALYFRLGYSMLLEWGHTQYFNNNNAFVPTGIYGIGNSFEDDVRKEKIQQSIAKKAKETFGNYDGMLGIVSNFNWAMNQDGGYDCTVRLVGLGAVMDSTRTNQSYVLPQGLVQEYKKNQKTIENLEAQIQQLQQKILNQQNNPPAQTKTLLPVPKTLSELSTVAATYDNNYDTFFTEKNAYYKASEPGYTVNNTANLTPDFFYIPVGKPGQDTADDITNLKNKYGGLYRTQTAGSSPGKFSFINFIPYNASNVTINTAALDDWAKSYLANLITPYQKPVDTNYQYPIQFIFDNQTTSIEKGINQFSKLPNNTEAQFNFILTQGTRSVPTAVGTKEFYFRVGYSLVSVNQQQFYPTQGQIVDALGTWFDGLNTATYEANNSRTISDVTFTPKGTGEDKEIIIRGTSDVILKNVAIKTNATIQSKQDVTIRFTFETNDTGLILNGAAASQIGNVQRAVQSANTGDTNGSTNQASSNQTNSPEGFQSALQAMLTVIKLQAQSHANNTKDADVIDISTQTELFYRDGIMNGVLTDTSLFDPKVFSLVQYAKKGFNSNLFLDPALYNITPDVNFKDLCKAFIIKYPQGGIEGSLNMIYAPVYIPFGYLLAFLNNMCLLYDSVKSLPPTGIATGDSKRPYFYIDFNPETNFCLTSPQQLSVDPLICLIPFNCTDDQYKSIYPNVVKLDPIFKPQSQNIITGFLNDNGSNFKTDLAYQGKTMNILLNVDYLLGIIKEFVAGDAEHAVNLQPFLQRILVDVNKCLGNTNSFRVAYRDDSNTVQIQDDQYVPGLAGEPSIMSQKDYSTRLANQPSTSGLIPLFSNPDAPGQLPVYGKLGIAREFQIKTVMSTKMASMIAISAQAETGSVNAKDHSSLSYLNRHFTDRYKHYIVNPSLGPQGSNDNSKNKVQEKSNDQVAAEMFDNHIATIYSNTSLFSTEKIELAKNYYIERMSKVKSGDLITSAAPFIPVEVEIVMDGISGIIMGNAFTIPEDRLPLSLRGENGKTKIAFIVTGLTNTIESNQWLTRLRGQMIKLREAAKVPSATTIIGNIQKFATVPITNSTSPSGTGLFVNSNAAAFSTYLFGTVKSGLDTKAPAHPNWGGLESIWQNNNAWDLSAQAGTPIYAIADGTISGVGFSENGQTVWGYKFTLTSNDNTFFFTHLDSVVVADNSSVKKGQLVGYVGQWPLKYGRLASYPHLHLGLKVGKLSNYIDGTGKLL